MCSICAQKVCIYTASDNGPIDAPIAAAGGQVSDYTALLDLFSWRGSVADTHGTSAIVTYSFSTAAQPYLVAEGYTVDFANSFSAFSETQKTLARNAFNAWGSVSGLVFIEVAAGQGSIQLGKFDFQYSPNPTAAGFAAMPYIQYDQQGIFSTLYNSPDMGDVYIDRDYADDPMFASDFAHVILHEIGHAIGLKHPFDGSPTLVASLDNGSQTVMSYTGPRNSTLGPLDIQAIQYLYGTNAQDGTGLSSYNYNATTGVLSLVGTAGADRIFGGYEANVIQGGLGADIIGGFEGNDRLDGGDGDDYIFGGDGDDVLIGGAGNDRIFGGTGFISNPYFDTVDYSGISAALSIDLSFYQTSGGVQYNASSSASGLDYLDDIDAIICGSGDDNVAAAFDALVVYGGNGNDFISGIKTSNVGAITAFGQDGNDVFSGGGANDLMYGGVGLDRANFAGFRSDYFVYSYNAGGTVTTAVVDVASGAGRDGTDYLQDIETLRFSVTDFKLAGAQQNKISNVSGSRFDDVIFHSTQSGQSYGYLSNGVAIAANGVLSTAYGAAWQAVDSGDVNGDGRADIIYQNASSGYVAFGIMGASGVGSIVQISNALTVDWRLVGVADVDGDAWLDIVVQNRTTHVVSIGDMTGSTLNGWMSVSAQGASWQVNALGDVNGDGRADLIYKNVTTGDVTAAIMNASGQIASYQGLTGAITANWAVRDAGDVNRDGYADVIIQNQTSGDISYINMANGVASGFGTVVNGVGSVWQMEGMADYNNDGDMDAIIRNTAGSGDTYFVNMEFGGFSGFTMIAQGIGSQWYVV